MLQRQEQAWACYRQHVECIVTKGSSSTPNAAACGCSPRCLTAQIRTLQRRLYEVEHRADAGSTAAAEGEGADDSDAMYAAGEVPRLLAHSRRAAAEMERYGQVSGDVLQVHVLGAEDGAGCSLAGHKP